MKRSLVVPAAISLAALIALALLFSWWRGVLPGVGGAVRTVAAADLVPPDTLLFVELPDLRRTAQRWPASALAKLWAEPEVQAFLEKPRSAQANAATMEKEAEKLAKLGLRQGFLAIIAWTGESPQFVAGFSAEASQSAVETVLAEPRANYRRSWPAGRADLVQYGGSQIETYSEGSRVIAECFRDGWYLVSNTVPAMHAVIDRLDGKTTAPAAATLASDARFRRATAPVPADADLLAFGRIDLFRQRLTAAMTAAGQPAGLFGGMDDTEAFGFATRMEPGQFRDVLFLSQPGGVAEPPLPRRALPLITPSTLLYTSRILPAKDAISPGTAAGLAMIPGFAGIDAALRERGLKAGDFGAAFGPELSVLLDWPAGAGQPGFVLTMDTRDEPKARAFVEAMVSSMGDAAAWKREEPVPGLQVWSPVGKAGMIPIPAFALSPKAAVLAFTPEAAQSAMTRLAGAPGETPSDPAVYKAALTTVREPSSGFGYIDLRTLWQRLDVVLRPVLAMSLALNPGAGTSIDAGKLPAAETISRHLGVTVYSESKSADGSLTESVGPLTLNQAILGIGAGAVAAALPALQQQFGGMVPPTPKTPVPASAPEPVTDR